MSLPVRSLRLSALRAAYRRGSLQAARGVHPEEADASIVELGVALRRELIAAYERKHAATG
jgi:hypothetical protein